MSTSSPATPQTPIGLTVASFQGLGPKAMLEASTRAAQAGAASIWTAETTGPEAFTTLAALASAAPGCALGTGVIPIQLRTPLLAAQSATTLAAFNPGAQVLLGVGISSPVVVGKWHGAPYGDAPIGQTAAYLRRVRQYLDGETVTDVSGPHPVSGSAMRIKNPGKAPQLVLAALNQQMLRLAGELADGVLLNYLPASAVPWCVEQVRIGEAKAGRATGGCTIYAYVHVGVCDPDEAESAARRDLYSYAVVEGYATAFTRAGFSEEIDELRAARSAGNRERALAAISRRMIDAIDICGDAPHIAAAMRSYVDAGVDHPVVMPLPWGPDRMQVINDTIDATMVGSAPVNAGTAA